MKRLLIALVALICALALAGCGGPSEPKPTATPTDAPTATPTPGPTSTPVPLEMLYSIEVHEPTCVANGYSVYVNNETGGINIRDEVPRLKHTWIIDPETGKEVCSMCGKEKTNERY